MSGSYSLRQRSTTCATAGGAKKASGEMPAPVLSGVVWQRVEGREWTITVRDFSPEKVQQVRAIEGVEHADVIDLGLEELFKDFIRGQRVAQ